jgi:alkylated DNA repair dioxygenase AlkB
LLLQKIRYKIAEVCDTDFTSVLLNLYRDGKDSNGWHADNEKELGQNPVIASLSFGAARNFQLKHNSNPERLSVTLALDAGHTQHCWKHQIPKTAKPVGAALI